MVSDPVIQEECLTTQEIADIFKQNVANGWCYIEKDSYFKFCKVDENEHSDLPQISFLFTLCLKTGKVNLSRFGVRLDLQKIAFGDYNE
jgi:hypothetical protein